MKPLKIDITQIKCHQVFGYPTRYTKLESIKHRRKKIDDKLYDTRKSDMLVYSNTFDNENSFYVLFIYRTQDGEYFKRTFGPMEETFDKCDASYVTYHLNQNKSLF